MLLIHGSGARGVCVWPKEIPTLAAAGYQVLAIDHACVGASDCPTVAHDLVDDIEAGVRHLRSRGARTVVVVGASAGTAEVIVSAAVPTVPLTAAVALSPVGLDRPVRPAGRTPRTAREASARIRVPMLYVVAADDTVSSPHDTRALYATTPPTHRSILDLPSGGHAQQLLFAGDDIGGPVYERFLAFLRRHSGG